MQLTFWGVHGAYPFKTDALHTKGFHTACVSIETEHYLLIFDAGSGLMQLNEYACQTNKEIILCLSHFHLDHVAWLPYFSLLHQQPKKLRLCHPDLAKLQSVYHRLFNPDFFPVKAGDPLFCHPDELSLKGLRISTCELNHPGGSVAYKVSDASRTCVYATDNELSLANKKQLKAFFKGCDLLIHDAFYFKEEKQLFEGWGHSFINDVIAFAAYAEVKRLALFHYHPKFSNQDFDAIREAIPNLSLASNLEVILSADGMCIEL